jgi:hypothetical protein
MMEITIKHIGGNPVGMGKYQVEENGKHIAFFDVEVTQGKSAIFDVAKMAYLKAGAIESWRAYQNE